MGEYVLTIGRDRSCDVVIDSPHVSPRHAEVRAVAGGFRLVDLGSLNGTRVGRTLMDAVKVPFGGHLMLRGSERIWLGSAATDVAWMIAVLRRWSTPIRVEATVGQAVR